MLWPWILSLQVSEDYPTGLQPSVACHPMNIWMSNWVTNSCSATSPLCDRLLAFHDLWHAAGFFHEHSGHWNTSKQRLQTIAAPLHQTHAQWNSTHCSRRMSAEQVWLPSISFSSLNVAKAAKAYSILFLQPPQLMLGPNCAFLLCRNFSRTSAFMKKKWKTQQTCAKQA